MDALRGQEKVGSVGAKSARRMAVMVVAFVALVSLWAFGPHTSRAVAAGGASFGQETTNPGDGPCHALRSTEAASGAMQVGDTSGVPALTVGARRYVAAWPRAVFDHFTAMENWSTLFDIREVCGAQAPLGAGSSFTLILSSGAEVAGVVTAWQEDRAFTARLQVEGMRTPLVFSLEIEPVPDGSEVQLDVATSMRGAMTLLLPVAGGDGETGRYLDRVLRRAKAGVEQ